MNGYPDHVIEKTTARKLKKFTLPTDTVKKCPVCFYVPWLEIPSVRHESKIKASAENIFLQWNHVLFLQLALFFLQCNS